MPHEFQFALILFGLMAFALLAKRIENSWITLPIFFTGLGLAFGPLGFGLIDLDIENTTIHTVAEITLILTLFLDASKIPFRTLKTQFAAPTRLLLIGMPLTILGGTLLIMVLSPQIPWELALLTAAILTPTDAALAQPILADKQVPERIAEAINVESGLNDGLALPVIIAAALLLPNAANSELQLDVASLTQFIGAQIILGPLVGIGLGWIGAKLLDFAATKDLTTPVFEGIFFLCVALCAYFIAETVGGNGFICAFTAGLVFGNVKQTNQKFIAEFLDGESTFLTMLTFIMFGAVLAPVGLAHADWTTLIIAIGFLTLVRMVPVAISLVGLNYTAYEKFILGWFGPKGLASILFALFIAEKYKIAGTDQMLACVVLTVGLSILVHGISAHPLARHFEQFSKKAKANV